MLEHSSADFLGINIYDVYADICLPHAEAVVSQLAGVNTSLPVSLGAAMHAAARRKQRAASLAGQQAQLLQGI